MEHDNYYYVRMNEGKQSWSTPYLITASDQSQIRNKFSSAEEAKDAIDKIVTNYNDGIEFSVWHHYKTRIVTGGR